VVGIEVACQRGGRQRNLRALRIHTEVLDVSTRSDQLCIRKKVVGGAILLKDNQGAESFAAAELMTSCYFLRRSR
jgi:hypothetical protein